MQNVRKIVLVLAAILAGAALAAQSNPGAIVNHYATRNFVSGEISKADLDSLLAAGIRAPSANNRQPWNFTVVQTLGIAQKIIPGCQEGNVLIVISATGVADHAKYLDCALATESIYLQAQALGLGSRIYTGPVDNINKKQKSLLGIANTQTAIAVVRVGKVAAADAASGASPRKDTDSLVNYR